MWRGGMVWIDAGEDEEVDDEEETFDVSLALTALELLVVDEVEVAFVVVVIFVGVSGK
jgi:hypothetical protein